MLAGKFELPTLEGEALLGAVEARMPPPADGDDRTTSQRRADALGDLARDALESPTAPIVGGERPHINVHVDLAALQGGLSRLHEKEDGFVLDPFLVSQPACDASVSRIVFGPGSVVLDVGRKTRVIPAALRRAVARDRHCVKRDCGRKPGWCDVHHIVPWSEGGETVIDNLCLLCRYHHSQLHLGLITLDDLEIRPLAGAARSRST
jgi:hypothetical protein